MENVIFDLKCCHCILCASLKGYLAFKISVHPRKVTLILLCVNPMAVEADRLSSMLPFSIKGKKTVSVFWENNCESKGKELF